MKPLAARQRISLELPADLLKRLDALKREWGLRSRGDLFQRLLETGLSAGTTAVGDPAVAPPEQHDSEFDEQGALVLVARRGRSGLEADFEAAPVPPHRDPPIHPAADPAAEAAQRRDAIDLPGFVRRQSSQLKQSHEPRSHPPEVGELLPIVAVEQLERALITAQDHWRHLYGSSPNDAVLNAAMQWLAQEIWPQSDQSDGRLFSWSLALQVVRSFCPDLSEGPASFARVVVVAGLLEDPFSASTLDLRVPTLIRRFVHRLRKGRRQTLFQTLEHTMTLHGALKLLRLPTEPGHRLSLREIREAYRQLALETHPDSGGSTESMRRLNEAYQLLKELYRPAD